MILGLLNYLQTPEINTETVQVIKVVDGDTIHINQGGNDIKVRLYGIDCMESSANQRAYKQAYYNHTTIEEITGKGKQAKKDLEKILAENDNQISIKTYGKDKYNRVLGVIYDNSGKSINDMMLNTPNCIVYNYK